MTSRLRRRSSVRRSTGITYDPDAAAYFAAFSITSLSEKANSNTYILAIKANGRWATRTRVYIRSTTSQAACLGCCKSLTSQTNVNGATFSSSGMALNGTTQYLRGDIAPSASSEVTTTSASICVYINPGDAFQTVAAGCSSGADVMRLVGEAAN